jgi:hypothetical protein
MGERMRRGGWSYHPGLVLTLRYLGSALVVTGRRPRLALIAQLARAPGQQLATLECSRTLAPDAPRCGASPATAVTLFLIARELMRMATLVHSCSRPSSKQQSESILAEIWRVLCWRVTSLHSLPTCNYCRVIGGQWTISQPTDRVPLQTGA